MPNLLVCKACQFTFPYISLIPSLFLFQNSSHLLRDYNQPITDLTALVTATSPQSCFIHVPLFATLWTVTCQTPLSMEFSRQEYSSGLPCPPPGNLSDPGVKPRSLASPASAGSFFTASATWEAQLPPAAAAAKLLQSCLTLWDPIDGSPSGSPVPRILQARTLEWVAISFSNAHWKVKVKTLSHVRLIATPWTAAHQAPPSVGFSKQEYWSGVPLPSPQLPPMISQIPSFIQKSEWTKSQCTQVKKKNLYFKKVSYCLLALQVFKNLAVSAALSPSAPQLFIITQFIFKICVSLNLQRILNSLLFEFFCSFF